MTDGAFAPGFGNPLTRCEIDLAGGSVSSERLDELPGGFARVARVQLPRRVPCGFQASWFPDA